LIFLFASVALAQMDIPVSFAPGVPGTGRQISGGSAVIGSGVTVRSKTIVKWIGATPDKPGRGLSSGGTGSGPNLFRRVIIDTNSGSYFGYELAFGPGDATAGRLATFQPPSDGFAQMIHRPPGAAPLTSMPLPKYPAPQIVHDGDILEIDLMASPDGQLKLTDYVEIHFREPEAPAAAAATAEPRDFTVDDGPLRFEPGPVTVRKQGQPLQGSLPFDGKPGATFWVAFPGQGRYILSLTPQSGFTKAGAIRGNAITFQDAGQEYELRFMTPIAGAGKAWNLYVMHDPTYAPNPNQRYSVSTGTDRLENLAPKP
jgi:hypothetical protein